ncbi:MAG TPA: MFS transporter [Rhizomicrobium sp.]|jgi:MFS family permease
MAQPAQPDEAIAGAPALRRGGAVSAVLLQTVLLFTLSTLPTPVYRDYARAFHFGILTLTLIYATYVAGTLLTLFVLGRLSDQIGRARVSLPAIFCAALAAVLFLLADSAAMLFAARLVTGIAAGLSSGTAVAWLKELQEGTPERTISVRTVAANLFGLGFGPLLCGLAATYLPVPSIAPYAIYLLLLVPLAIAVVLTRETVAGRKPLAEVSLNPGVGVPPERRAQFLAPGVITFVIFALVGFYSAIAPDLLAVVLHITNKAAIGSTVFELFLAGLLADYATRRLGSRAAMLWGAGFVLPALACLVGAQLDSSLPLLLGGTALGGMALGLAYRGTLEVTNALAPEDRRAELVSTLFVCGNLGLAMPVIGIGIVSALTRPEIANLVFAAVVAVLTLAGLAFGLANREK